MSSADFAKAIAALLRPAGFTRFAGRQEWRRERDDFLEEVDLQKFRGEPVVTINFALRHQWARLCVDEVAGSGYSGGDFSISRRIGTLLGPKDLSWQADDPEGPGAVRELIRARLLPYFDQMRTLSPYIEELAKYYGGRWTLITPRLELAVLLHKSGAPEEARQLLADPPDRIGPKEKARVAAIHRHLFGEPARGA